MRCITKENAIDRLSLELVQLLPFLKKEAFTTKDMEVTHLGCATVHQFIAGFLVVNPEVDPVQHISHGIDRLSPETSQSHMLVEHRPSHFAFRFSFPPRHSGEAYTDSKTSVQVTSHGKRFQSENF
jgi:hypothetical protein